MTGKMNYQEAHEKLAKYGQEHALKYYEELTGEQQELLLNQIADTDFSVLASVKDKKGSVTKGRITPLAAMQLSEIHAKEAVLKPLGRERWERFFLREEWEPDLARMIPKECITLE